MRACFFLLLFWPVLTHAGEVAIYRCIDTSGGVTLQNMPCPKGMRQEKKMMQSVNTVPMTPSSEHPTGNTAPSPSVPPASTPATPESGEPATAPKPLPPPNLYRCTARGESGSYVTEDSEPASRCVALRTTGLDGNPQAGAGTACEVVQDQCARIPDEGLCDAWRKKRDEAEVAWRFTRPDTEEKNRAAFERVRRVHDQSTCGSK